LAALTAHFIAIQFTPLVGIVCGGTASLVVLFGLFYLMRVLESEDRDRFTTLAGMLPAQFAGPVIYLALLLIRQESTPATPTGVQ
jgi:hypothetical protein